MDVFRATFEPSLHVLAYVLYSCKKCMKTPTSSHELLYHWPKIKPMSLFFFIFRSVPTDVPPTYSAVQRCRSACMTYGVLHTVKQMQELSQFSSVETNFWKYCTYCKYDEAGEWIHQRFALRCGLLRTAHTVLRKYAENT